MSPEILKGSITISPGTVEDDMDSLRTIVSYYDPTYRKLLRTYWLRNPNTLEEWEVELIARFLPELVMGTDVYILCDRLWETLEEKWDQDGKAENNLD